jgi:RNA polymerase sigma-70 factor (ECF subfamily)
MRAPQMRHERTILLEGAGETLAAQLSQGAPPFDEGRVRLMPSEIDVVLAKEGDREAFRRLYEEHRERIFRTACRYTVSRQDAEDILQETFIKAFTRIRTFDFRISPNFSSWLAAICVNTALDDLRRRGRRRGSKHVSLADLPKEIPADGPSPEAGAARRFAVERVRETLRVLSPGQRTIFDMRFTEHLDIREIAAALGCSESSVKTQLARALAKLRKTLEPERGKP